MPNPVRVLIVAPAPLSDDWAGGISNFVRSFVANMPPDFAVSIAGVANLTDTAKPNTWHDISLAGRDVRFMPVAHLGQRGVLRVPVKARAMWGLLRARPHVSTSGTVLQVHAPAMDLPLARRKAPMIRVVHNAPDNLAAHDAGTFWRHSARALRRAEASSFRRAERVFFVDRATYDHYADGTSGHMCYLPNGIDTTEFAPRDSEQRDAARAQLAHEFGISQAGPWLLFCGRLDRQKDPELLIATFAHARRLSGLDHAQLVIVGSGPLLQATEQAARDSGVRDATHFVGTLEHDKLPAMFAAADTLLLTSAYEGAPFVVLEALACGLPVVSTAVGDVPILVHHERTGWIAPEHTAAELARGVAWAVSQPRDEIAPRAAASMSAYRIQDVLAPFYEAHRRLTEGSLE